MAEFGGGTVVPERGQRFAHQFLVRERTVVTWAVSEGDAALHSYGSALSLHSCRGRATMVTRLPMQPSPIAETFKLLFQVTLIFELLSLI